MRPASLVRIVLLTIPALLVSPLAAESQQPAVSHLSVTVTDHVSGLPLANATVRLPGLGLGSLTNEEGRVMLENIPQGTHQVEVRMLGYGEERMRVGFGEDEVSMNVGLLLSPIALAPVRVRGEARVRRLLAVGFFDRMEKGFGSFATRSEIEKWGGHSGRISDALWRMPGMRMQTSESGTGYVVASSRGRCAAEIYIDGMWVPGLPEASLSQVQNLDAGSKESRSGQQGTRKALTVTYKAMPIDQVVNVADVEAMEWYSGPATTPMQFRRGPERGRKPGCGTLVIWTRMGR